MNAGRVQPEDGELLHVWRLHAGHRINIYLATLLVLLVLGLLAHYLTGLDVRPALVALLLLGAVPSALVAIRAALRQASLRVVLTRTHVLNVRLRSVERVPLDDVRGVVVARLVRDTWTTWLILDDGAAVRLVAPAFVFWSRRRSRRSPSPADEDEIAASPSGRQASVLHQAVAQHRYVDDESVDDLARRSAVGPRILRYWSPADDSSLR